MTKRQFGVLTVRGRFPVWTAGWEASEEEEEGGGGRVVQLETDGVRGGM